LEWYVKSLSFSFDNLLSAVSGQLLEHYRIFLEAKLFLTFYVACLSWGLIIFVKYDNDGEIASIWLTCHLQECTLEITPPGTRTMTVIFPRSQLHNAHAIKTDKNGKFVAMDTLRDKPLDPRRKKKKNKGNPDWHNKGPDSQGRYGTYEIKFWKKSPESDNKDNFKDADFAEVKDYFREIGDDMYGLSFRHFSLSQSRMRVRSNVNKVESYVKRRRQKLLIKESATLPWQAILCLVFGLVGTMLTCLIGQFWDDEPRRQGGPGARRSHQKSYRGNGGGRRNPSRPSSGSQYRKGY